MTANQTANTLVDLCARLRNETVGKTTEEAFDFLQSLLGKDIRIRYEIVRDPTSRDGAEQEDAPKGRFSHLNALKVGRVLLTSNRLGSDFTREIVRSCNGVVLEYPGWRVLSVPAPMFNPRFRAADVISNMDAYSVYEIKDGTTVTLYHYNDQWRMSSTNGFDVRDYQWMGPTTYFDAIAELSKMYPDFGLDRLDKSRSYTVGFRHFEFHPLRSDPQKMWLIQSCDLAAINGPSPALVTDFATDVGIPLQVASAFDVKGRALFKLLQDRNTNAIGRYLSSVRDGNAAPDIHYGYVLRSGSLSGADSANSDIILESDLLKNVRFLMYNLPKRKFDEAAVVTAANRLEYTVLRAYLSCSTKFVFLNLFPQFSDHYRKYDQLFNKLSNRVLGALRSRNTRDALASAIKSPKDGMGNRIDRLAHALVVHIESCCKINGMDPQGPNIVVDFMMDKKHLDLYYTCLFSDPR